MIIVLFIKGKEKLSVGRNNAKKNSGIHFNTFTDCDTQENILFFSHPLKWDDKKTVSLCDESKQLYCDKVLDELKHAKK